MMTPGLMVLTRAPGLPQAAAAISTRSELARLARHSQHNQVVLFALDEDLARQPT